MNCRASRGCGYFVGSVVGLAGILLAMGNQVHAGSPAVELHDAIRQGDLEAVKRLIENGVSVEFADSAGRTPLYAAALNGKQTIAEYLLARGADLTNGVSFRSRRLPMHAAAQEGWSGMVRMFLKRGADPNVEDRGKRTPLLEAAWGAHPETVSLLIENGAAVGVKDKTGHPPAFPHYPQRIPPARFDAYRQTLGVLVTNGMDVNVRDDAMGLTPLIYAAYIGDLGTVKYLISKGADPSIASRAAEDGTALGIARRQGHKEIVAFLEKFSREKAAATAATNSVAAR